MNAYFAAMFLTFVGLVIVLGTVAYALEVDANQKLTESSRHVWATPVDSIPDLPKPLHPLAHHKWPTRAVAITAGLVVLAVGGPAQAGSVRPHSGEGWISLVSRTCGSSANWQTIAKANGASAPRWTLPLRNVTVQCPGKASTGASKPPAKPSAKWLRPIAGGWCSSGFGMRWGVLHDGIDLAAPRGTRIRASAAGTVATVAYQPVWYDRYGRAHGGAGWYVKVTMPGGWFYMDMHMKQRPSVRVGQRVVQGQTLGYVGATGSATGPHVHLRVHHGSKAVNPATLGLGC